MQVQIGNKVKKPVARSDEGIDIHVGDMCLLDLPKWADYWPLLGQVVAVEGSKVQIRWWSSSMTGICKPEVLKSTQGKGHVDSLEIVDKKQIWLYGFSLTASNRLSQAIRERIESYDED